MSASMLYHAFGIKGVRYISTQYENKEIIFHGEVKGRKFSCPKCKNKSCSFKGKKVRRFRK